MGRDATSIRGSLEVEVTEEARALASRIQHRIAELDLEPPSGAREIKTAYLEDVHTRLANGEITKQEADEYLEAGASLFKAESPDAGLRIAYRPFPEHVWGAERASFLRLVAAARNAHVDAVHFVQLIALGAAWGPAMDYELVEGWRKQCGLYGCLLTETGRGKSRLFDWLMEPIYRLEERVQKRAEAVVKAAKLELQVLKAKKEAVVAMIKQAAKKGKPTDVLEGDLSVIEDCIGRETALARMPSVWFSSVTNEFAAQAAAASEDMLAIVSPETPMLRIASGGYSSGQAAVEVLNSGFDGEPVGDGRVSRDQVKVRPRVACAWGCQPRKLQDYAARCPELIYSGFLARFMLFIPLDLAGTRCRKLRQFPKQSRDAYSEGIVSVAEALRAQKRPVFRFSAEARSLYEEWAQRWEAEYRTGGTLALLYGFSERIHDYVGRIAAILHVHHFGPEPAEISAQTLQMAIEVVEWVILQNRLAYRELGFGRENELAAALWSYICRAELKKTTLRDLQRNGPGQRKHNAAQHRQALSILAEEGKVEIREVHTGRTGHTRVEVIVLGADPA